MLPSLNSSALSKSQSLMQIYAQQLSSGKRINSAADDPAGLSIADAMTSQLGGQQRAIGNITSGLSLTDIADSALSQVTDSLQQIRDLAVQAGNGSLNSTDLQSIQDQINGLAKNIDSISANAQFNGRNLLDGSFSAQLQTGPNAGDTLGLSLGNVSTNGLGLSGLDVSSSANATSALDAIDSAIKNVGSLQSNVAATSAGLNTDLSNLSGSYVQLAQSQSRIQDADFAQASSGLSQAGMQNQTAVYALKLYQENQKTAVSGLFNQ